MEEQHLAHQNKSINRYKQYSMKAFLFYLHFLKNNKNRYFIMSLIKIGKVSCCETCISINTVTYRIQQLLILFPRNIFWSCFLSLKYQESEYNDFLVEIVSPACLNVSVLWQSTSFSDGTLLSFPLTARWPLMHSSWASHRQIYHKLSAQLSLQWTQGTHTPPFSTVLSQWCSPQLC